MAGIAIRPRPPGDKTPWWKYVVTVGAVAGVVAVIWTIVAVVS